MRRRSLACPTHALSRADLSHRCGGLPAGNHDRGKARGRIARIGFAFPWNLRQQEDHVVPHAGLCRAGPSRLRSGFAGTRAHEGTVFARARGTVRRGASPRTTRARDDQCRSHNSRRAFDGRRHRRAHGIACSSRGLDRHLTGPDAGRTRSHGGKTAFQRSPGSASSFSGDDWLARTGVDARQCRRPCCLAKRRDREVPGDSGRIARQRSFQPRRDASFAGMVCANPTLVSDCSIALTPPAHRCARWLHRPPADCGAISP